MVQSSHESRRALPSVAVNYRRADGQLRLSLSLGPDSNRCVHDSSYLRRIQVAGGRGGRSPSDSEYDSPDSDS